MVTEDIINNEGICTRGCTIPTESLFYPDKDLNNERLFFSIGVGKQWIKNL
jgi:hypothetical protein